MDGGAFWDTTTAGNGSHELEVIVYDAILEEVMTSCTLLDDCEGSDFEPDGDVDLADFAVMAEHWLECTNPYPPCNYLP